MWPRARCRRRPRPRPPPGRTRRLLDHRHGARQAAGRGCPERAVRADAATGLVERDPPVDADDVGAGAGHEARAARRCPTPKWMRRHAEVGQPVEDGPAWPAARSARSRPGRARRPSCRRAARPGRPRRDLGPQRRHGHVGQGVEQRSHRSGVAVHERLRLGVGARRPAFDQVARHGERRAGEADERDAASRRAPRRPGGRPRRRTGVSASGSRGRSRARSASAAEGLGHHGPAARLHLDAEADGVQRHHDVGEEDGGVDPVAADRLQGELGGQRRVARWRRGSCRLPGRRGTRAATARPGA